MLNLNSTVFLPFLIAFIATIVVTPLSIIFLKKAKVIDDPKSRKHPAILHKIPTVRGGGIPLFIGILIPSLLFLPFENITITLFIAAFISLIVGVIDDKYDLSPYFRFLTNFVSASLIVWAGIQISFITNPFGGILNFGMNPGVSFVFTVLWIVWLMNMLNWSKGVDGQMPGIIVISGVVIGLLSLRFPALDHYSLISAKIGFMLAGASLGFLIFNFYPAKIFPGYGATAIYFLLAVVSILASAKLATAILVMGIPMIDGIFTITRRILSGKSPFWHDRKHLHHLLLELGYTQRRIALFYWIISAILGALALVLTSQGKLFAIIMLLIIVGGGILFLQLSLKEEEDE